MRKPAPKNHKHLREILRALGITTAPCRRRVGPMETHADATLRKLLDEHGSEHVTLTLRVLTESAEANASQLTAPCILAVSDMLLAHRRFGAAGLALLEAFDHIDVGALYREAKLNRAVVPPRHGLATLLHQRLAAAFPAPAKTQAARKSRQLAAATPSEAAA